MIFRIKRKANAEEIKSTSIRYAVEHGYMRLWSSVGVIPAFRNDKKAFMLDFLRHIVKEKWHRGFALARGLGGNTNTPIEGFPYSHIRTMDGKLLNLIDREHAMFWSMAHYGDVRTLKILLNMVRIISKEERLAMLDHSKYMRKVWGQKPTEYERTDGGDVPAALDKGEAAKRQMGDETNPLAATPPPRPSRFKKLWDILVGSK